MSDKVYVVGGAGYLGARLVPVLLSDGWAPEVIDAGVYGHVPAAQRRDVLEEEPPGDGAPVIWLATVHREPDKFDTLSEEDRLKWGELMGQLMVEVPGKWIKAGHPLIYTSSMQVLAAMSASLYGYAKMAFEKGWVGTRGLQIFRFGTAWGGLDREPARVETAINSALLGRELTEDYVAWTTHIDRIVETLAYALCRPYLGTVENIVDSDTPTTGPEINGILSKGPRERTLMEQLWMREWDRAEALRKKFRKRKHFTRALAEHYRLPWPEGTAEEFTIKKRKGI